MSFPSVLIIGSGGVGTIASYSLCFNKKATVTSVLRSSYDIVTEKGFEIDSVDYGKVTGFRPHNIAKSLDDAAQYGPFDYVLVSTKNVADMSPLVAEVIAPVVTKTAGANTTVVLLQNGIEIEDPIIKAFPGHVVLSGISMISSILSGGNHVEHSYIELATIGYVDNKITPATDQEAIAKKFIEIYSTRNANGTPINQITYNDNVRLGRWRKLVYNASFNSVCAMTRLDTTRVALSGNREQWVIPIMKEIVLLAEADGNKLPETIIDNMVEGDKEEEYYKPSMLVDVLADRPMEVEVILGNTIRIGENLGYGDRIPYLKLVYRVLKGTQYGILERMGGAFKLPESRGLTEGKSYEDFRLTK
ncbi:hypothetical protein BABINDRAFT_161701 [Babjeviella inositovora NRRL Y-12698]|uniref:2-dehydropantoate 2-reductase n=1 Tax=Babjeviella inositovora NRRL Y-12698 TaxID=984486 RepID=A0A1E3QQT7_9ASCO|nr:uncharacterized protein BABINDRAFT_161701 [Babjeviella inositovora NRRL Y-12698]ODQ80066.1 hypothetical protein BABINDRAFT_161701 [Babjeviella inositovora NRRL Y-12698]